MTRGVLPGLVTSQGLGIHTASLALAGWALGQQFLQPQGTLPAPAPGTAMCREEHGGGGQTLMASSAYSGSEMQIDCGPGHGSAWLRLVNTATLSPLVGRGC